MKYEKQLKKLWTMRGKMKCKYKIGDKVIISKKFVRIPHGAMVAMNPVVATVTKISLTPSLGPGYGLKIGEKQLDIYYWESDIDGLSETQ